MNDVASGALRVPPPASPAPLALMGLELEYMIVDRATLDVRPISDRLFVDPGGEHFDDLPAGDFGWSKEVVRHVVEIKNPAPVTSLAGLASGFHARIRAMNARLAAFDTRLMPSAMHPWMDPRTETRIWDEPRNRINNLYASIFDLATHGWANLQSMHINLGFGGDGDFGAVHSAIRTVLPIIPAIAASSPFADGRSSGFLDYRLEVYRNNAAGFPTITGHVVPEPVRDRATYQENILAPMYRAIAAHDPDHVLRSEWLNSRGAIARFERDAIEIRVTDVQEAPRLDVAIASAVIGLVRGMHGGRFASLAAQDALPARRLARILFDCARHGGAARIDDGSYLELFGYPGDACVARDLWRHLSTAEPVVCAVEQSGAGPEWEFLLAHGTLASRLVRAAGEAPDRARLTAVYGRLCECLHEGVPFT